MTSVELITALAQTRLCRNLHEAELQMLLTYSKEMTFDTGNLLLKQGSRSEGIFIILEGAAIITAKILGAGTLNLKTLISGDFVGETSLIEGVPSTVSVTAAEKVRALFIADSYFSTLSVFFPAIKYRISQAVAEDMCARLQDLSKKISFYIMSSQMISKSIFSEVWQTFSRPREITFEDTKITREQFHQLDFFKDLTEDEFTALFNNCQLLEAGQYVTLIKKGETTPVCYIQLRGAVQSSITQDNKFAKLLVLAPFRFFCCASFVDKCGSVIDFGTCEKSILLKLNEEHLKVIQENHQSLWYKIFEEVCKTLVSLEQAANKLGIRLNTEIYNR